MRFDKDRLSHWFAIPLITWTVGLLVLYIPIGHFLFGWSIVGIAVFAGAACAGHLAVTPWLYSARPTVQNPTGNTGRNAAAVIVWFTLFALLFFYYLQLGAPINPRNTEMRLFLFATPIIFALICFAVLRLGLRHGREH